MLGGDGRLSKQSDSSGLGESTPAGTRVLSPGVPMIGGAGRSGDPGPGESLIGASTLSPCLIIGVTVTGCDGRLLSCGVDKLLAGVSAASAANLDFIMGVVVCGTSGVKQGVSCPLSCSVPCLGATGLCGVTSIILVNVAGGTGDLRRSSGFSVKNLCSNQFECLTNSMM